MSNSDKSIVNTPGPWRKCGGMTPGYIAICDSDNRYIVYGLATPEVCGHEYKARCVQDIDEQQANAKLMAASPRLLEACEMTLKYLQSGGSRSELWKVVMAACKDARGTH